MVSALKKRKNRQLIFTTTNKYFYLTRGDIISILYKHKGFVYFFTGICLQISKRSLKSPVTSILVRNIIDKVSVEVIILVNRLIRFTVKFLDYKRKKMYYKGSKLYFLRKLANRFSLVYTYSN